MTGKIEINQDLIRWLDRATSDLPGEVREMVRDEISAHYEDAVAEHRERGLTSEVAHRAAIAELGDAGETASGLCETHLAERSYVRAMIISAAFPIVYLLLEMKTNLSWAAYDFIFCAAILFPSLYVLRAFKRLLVGRYLFTPTDWLFPLLNGAIVMLCVPRMIPFLLGREALPFEHFTKFIVEAPWSLDTLLMLAACGGMALSGLSCILLSDRLAKLEDGLFGLRRPLRYTLLLTGVGMVGFLVGILAKAYVFGSLTNLLTIFAFLLTNTLWTLLFFRSVYRPLPHPVQMA